MKRLSLILLFATLFYTVALFAQSISGSASLTVSNNVVNWNTTFQTIDGFGGAAKASSSSLLTSGEASFLFGTGTNQVGLTMLRVAGCQLTDCSDLDSLSAIQNAVAAFPSLRVITTWWSAPAAWKTSGSTLTGDLSTSHYADFASLIQTYINDLAANGVTIYAVSPNNEPDIVAPGYDSMNMTDTELSNFIANNLGPTIGTNIYMPESSGWDGLFSLADTTLSSSANNFVLAYAAHQYDFGTDAQTNVPSSKHLWMTEYNTQGASSPDVTMTDGITVANLIHNTLVGANANAWIYWLIMGNGTGTQTNNQCLVCNGVNAKRLYVIGNYAKFVRPGMVMMQVLSNFGGVEISAFKDPVSRNFAVVAINTNGGSAPISLNFSGFTSGSIVPHVTDPNSNLVDQPSISGGAGFAYTLTGTSVTTFTGTAP